MSKFPNLGQRVRAESQCFGVLGGGRCRGRTLPTWLIEGCQGMSPVADGYECVGLFRLCVCVLYYDYYFVDPPE